MWSRAGLKQPKKSTRGGFLLPHRERLKVAFSFARRSVFITVSGAYGAQRWAFSASPGARVRFSIVSIEQARGSSVIQFAQRSVFITASGTWALSGGLLVLHRERV